MSIGYDIEDSNRSFEKKGLTGTVTRYTTDDLKFPCYIVSAPFEKYKLKVLKSMYQKVESYDEEESRLAIYLYFEEGGKRVGLGKIYPRQVKSFLQLFSTNKIVGFYDKDTVLENDYLYVLGG